MKGWGRRHEKTSSSPTTKHQARFAHKFLQMPAVHVDMGRGKITGHARLGDAASRSHLGALAAVGRLASFLGALKSGGEDMTSLVAANCNATARHKAAARSLERTSFGGAWGHGATGRGKLMGHARHGGATIVQISAARGALEPSGEANSWGTRGTVAQQTGGLWRHKGPWSHRARKIHGAREERRRSKRTDFCGARGHGAW